MGKLIVYCPGCGRMLFDRQNYTESFMQKKCNKCKKLITYNPEDGRVIMKDIPPRNTSSGCRFY